MKLNVNQIWRRVALCKSLFLAPPEIFTYVDRYIEIALDTYIEKATGERPYHNFPLDFWNGDSKDRLPPDPTKWNYNLQDKPPKARAELCRLLFIVPASMFRDIETYFDVCLRTYIHQTTGKKPNGKNPLNVWIKDRG